MEIGSIVEVDTHRFKIVQITNNRHIARNIIDPWTIIDKGAGVCIKGCDAGFPLYYFFYRVKDHE